MLAANGRMESTTWTATVLGPPLGGAAIGLFGPVTTVLADAVSYLLSATGIRAIGGTEPHPDGAPADARRTRAGDLIDGWRHILTHPALRPLFLCTLMVNGLIMATEPLLAVLMLGRLGFAPWQYGLAFADPVHRRADRLAAVPPAGRRGSGGTGSCSSAGCCAPAGGSGWRFMRPGVAGLVLVIVVQFGLVLLHRRVQPGARHLPARADPGDLVARTLSAWTVSTRPPSRP